MKALQNYSSIVYFLRIVYIIIRIIKKQVKIKK